MVEKDKIEVIRDIVEHIIFEEIRDGYLEVEDSKLKQRWGFLAKAVMEDRRVINNINKLLREETDNKEFLRQALELFENE